MINEKIVKVISSICLFSVMVSCAPSQTITPVPTSSVPPVLGTIDGLGGDLRYGGTIVVVGWAVDMQKGIPVKGVEVIVDGKWPLQATIGDSRPDVVKTLGLPGVEKSGWTIQFSLGTLAPGRHNLNVLVYDSQNKPIMLNLIYPFDIAPLTQSTSEAVAQQPSLNNTASKPIATTVAITAEKNLITATNEITLSTVITGNFEGIEGTARQGWVIIARGWAGDTKIGGPASRVDLLLDGKVALTSTVNIERPDLLKELKPGYLKSGWIMRLPLDNNFPLGKHVLKVVAYDSAGKSAVIGSEIVFEALPAVQNTQAKPTATPTQKEQTKDAPKDQPKEGVKEPAPPPKP